MEQLDFLSITRLYVSVIPNIVGLWECDKFCGGGGGEKVEEGDEGEAMEEEEEEEVIEKRTTRTSKNTKV